MAKITLISIDWTPVPESPKQVVISYRKTADPDVAASYKIVVTGYWVPVNGEFTNPIVIDNLNPGTDYTVKVISTCGGYSFEQNFVFDDSTADFSYGFSLGFRS